MSPGPTTPSASALGAVVKTPNVYVPGGRPAGQARLTKPGWVVGVAEAGITMPGAKAGKLWGDAVAVHLTTTLAKPGVAKAAASPAGHPSDDESAGGTR